MVAGLSPAGWAHGVAGSLPGRGGADRPSPRGRCAPRLAAPPMSPTALERLSLYFGVARTRQGILARAALGTPGEGDGALAQELAAAMSAEFRPDGTIMGGAVPTIWRAHELLDLGRGAADPALATVLTWLMSRQ